MKVSIEKAVEMAKDNQSLKGFAISDLNDSQVRAADALVLAQHGILIPEQNIYYDDADVAYDPDFDEVEWDRKPLNMTWEEKFQLAKQLENAGALEEELSVKVKIPDREVRQWVHLNADKMGQILSNFIVDIYKANKIIKD
jgi:hypothetical protein